MNSDAGASSKANEGDTNVASGDRRPALFVLPAKERDALGASAASGSLGKMRGAEWLAGLRELPLGYRWPSHYLAFVLAYMEDEEVVAEQEWELGAALSKASRLMVSVNRREGTSVDQLSPALYDINELVDDFHGGGAHDDPDAKAGLREGIKLLRDGFDALGPTDSLVILI